MAFKNCITAASKIEDIFSGSALDLYISPRRSRLEQLNELIGPMGRKFREIKNPEEISLEEGEWLTAMFGPFPKKVNYEGIPEEFDYHFIFQEGDIWKHRDGIGEPITNVEKDLFEFFISKGYQPHYFAVKQVED